MNSSETLADTIVAMATPAGRGGVGIIRVSGPATRAIAVATTGMLPTPRLATLTTFVDETQVVLDEGIPCFFLGRTPLPVKMYLNCRAMVVLL